MVGRGHPTHMPSQIYINASLPSPLGNPKPGGRQGPPSLYGVHHKSQVFAVPPTSSEGRSWQPAISEPGLCIWTIVLQKRPGGIPVLQNSSLTALAQGAQRQAVSFQTSVTKPLVVIACLLSRVLLPLPGDSIYHPISLPA